MQKYRGHRKIIIWGAVMAIAITCVINALPASAAGKEKIENTEIEDAEEITEKIKAFDPAREKFLEMPAIKQNGEIMMPFKKIFESFGAVVTWNEQTETARASNPKSNFTLSVKIGEGKAVINGLDTAVSVPAQIVDGVPYVPLDLIRQIPGAVISEDINGDIQIWSADIFIKRHGWTQLSDGLVAHAGGGLYCATDEDKDNEDGEERKQIQQIYTNSREALEYSYGNGHRVFEMDFLLTSDGRLAAVHDWELVDGEKSSEEWRDVKIYGMYDALFIEDVYEFMLEYPDTFLVTDTKSFLYDGATNRKQFEQLVNTAREMDVTLLKRIVPQVYDQNCYSIMMGVHAFDSVIYTLYESPDTPEEVAEFVAGYDNIKVVTMMWTQLTEDFYDALTGLSKYVYFFTINVPGEAEIFRMWGVRGFYTDFINPKLETVPAPNPAKSGAFINLLRKIYRLVRPSSLIQEFLLLFILSVEVSRGFLLCFIFYFLFAKILRKN